MLCNAYRCFWLSHLGGEATGMSWIEFRNTGIFCNSGCYNNIPHINRLICYQCQEKATTAERVTNGVRNGIRNRTCLHPVYSGLLFRSTHVLVTYLTESVSMKLAHQQCPSRKIPWFNRNGPHKTHKQVMWDIYIAIWNTRTGSKRQQIFWVLMSLSTKPQESYPRQKLSCVSPWKSPCPLLHTLETMSFTGWRMKGNPAPRGERK